MRRWLESLEDGLFQKSRRMPPPWGAVLRWLRYPTALIRDWLGGEINIRGDESRLHHFIVARAADGVQLCHIEGPRSAR